MNNAVVEMIRYSIIAIVLVAMGMACSDNRKIHLAGCIIYWSVFIGTIVVVVAGTIVAWIFWS